MFSDLEKIHPSYFGVFEDFSYFKRYRCLNKRYPKNMTFYKLENFDETKGH